MRSDWIVILRRDNSRWREIIECTERGNIDSAQLTLRPSEITSLYSTENFSEKGGCMSAHLPANSGQLQPILGVGVAAPLPLFVFFRRAWQFLPSGIYDCSGRIDELDPASQIDPMCINSGSGGAQQVRCFWYGVISHTLRQASSPWHLLTRPSSLHL